MSEDQTKRWHDFFPARVTVGVMAFLGTWVSYTARLNLTIAIIAMTPVVPSAQEDPECQTNVPKLNATQEPPEVPDHGPRYMDWDTNIVGLQIGAFFWASVVGSIPTGALADIFGARIVLAVTSVGMGVLTMLGPLFADIHWAVFLTSRLIIGLLGSSTFPALHSALKNWAPPQEKGKFVWCLLGGVFGTMVSYPIFGAMITTIKWPSVFYLSGAGSLLWGVAWWFLFRNTPEEHPRISNSEKEYILSSLQQKPAEKQRFPILDAITSFPFMILMIAHFGNMWGLSFIMTMAPKFMTDVLGFSLSKSSFLSSAPYLARLIGGLICSNVVDFCLKRDLLSVPLIRKAFTIASHIIPGVLVIAMGFTGCDPYASVALITVSTGFNGAATVTNLVNHHDLAPNYAGTLYGTMSALGALAGGIIPMFVGKMTENHNGLYEWSIILTVGGAVYLTSGAIFILFGSAKRQAWNDGPQKKWPCAKKE